jgi:hypothetical protein
MVNEGANSSGPAENSMKRGAGTFGADTQVIIAEVERNSIFKKPNIAVPECRDYFHPAHP